MQVLIIPVALYLLLYAPGRFLLRSHALGAAAGSRLLREVLLSACCTSWIGFVLAELGRFSLPALLGSLAVIAGVGWLCNRGQVSSAYRFDDLAGVVLLVVTWLWIAPPLDTRVLGSDSTGYLASGVHLARHGSLVIHDPTLPGLSPDLKRALFPSVVPDRGSPPYLRLMGSMVVRNLDTDEVLPAFHHLIAVWIAAFHELGGPAGGAWVITLFAGLSMWSIAAFTAGTLGSVAAVSCVGLLLFLSPQDWYSRFLMPEVPGQFFLWAGLSCLSLWSRSGSRGDLLTAAMAFGVAGLTRVENAVFLLVALVLAAALAPRTGDRRGLWPLAVAALIWLHAGIHLTVLRTHYFGNLRSLVAENLPALSPQLLINGVLLSMAFGAFAIWRRRASSRAGVALLVVAAAGLTLNADYRQDWLGLRLLESYAGVPTLLIGGIGLLASALSERRRDWAYEVFLILTAVVFAQVVLAPHATRVPIWTVRRAVSLVLPAFCIGVAFLSTIAPARWRAPAAALLFCLGMSGQLPSWIELRDSAYYRGAMRHTQAIATLLPPGARLLFDANLVASGLAQTLWAERDLPAYFFASADTTRLQELVASFAGAPVYWLNDGSSLPPQAAGIEATPVALYEFLLATPALDIAATRGAGVNWDYTVGVYSLRQVDGGPQSKTPGKVE
jgi:hypothetical protein